MLQRFNRFTAATWFADCLDAGVDARDTLVSYNLGPGQMALAAVRGPNDTLSIRPSRWGFLQGSSGDAADPARLSNARLETADTRPAYREAFIRRRCLIPADGYYVWRTLDSGRTQPYFVHLKDRRPFCFAGLWNLGEDADGHPLYSFTVLTRDALPGVRELQARMPVILDDSAWAGWLESAMNDPEDVRSLARTGSRVALEVYPISRRVDSLKNNDVQLLEPIGMLN